MRLQYELFSEAIDIAVANPQTPWAHLALVVMDPGHPVARSVGDARVTSTGAVAALVTPRAYARLGHRFVDGRANIATYSLEQSDPCWVDALRLCEPPLARPS